MRDGILRLSVNSDQVVFDLTPTKMVIIFMMKSDHKYIRLPL